MLPDTLCRTLNRLGWTWSCTEESTLQQSISNTLSLTNQGDTGFATTAIALFRTSLRIGTVPTALISTYAGTVTARSETVIRVITRLSEPFRREAKGESAFILRAALIEGESLHWIVYEDRIYWDS
jgi:hypothetical protein